MHIQGLDQLLTLLGFCIAIVLASLAVPRSPRGLKGAVPLRKLYATRCFIDSPTDGRIGKHHNDAAEAGASAQLPHRPSCPLSAQWDGNPVPHG